MITIQNLGKTYKGNVEALCNLDLEIPGTGMFGLLGVNGAGKTTLMRILAGLLNPTSGEVRVFDNDVTTRQGKQTVKNLLGYLPQELGLYPDLSAREFLDYIAVLKGVTDRAVRERQIAELLGMVRVADVADRRLDTYSGGMKQRVGIAQALLGEPKLLIVDEPTARLDPEERVRFRNLLVEVAQRCAVILSTHIVEDVSHSCSDLAVLWQGTVLFRGTPVELVARARGKVWTILGQNGERPDDSLSVVSMQQLPEGVQYRVLGEPGPGNEAIAVEPNLEDGYIWLMNQARKSLKWE
ncbi:MAG: ATP-binding cassette domain-containing protein [Chloroflexota bacterium]|nr:ATP-binding cassette domain-containing protein [Chloroflexota bacterium]